MNRMLAALSFLALPTLFGGCGSTFAALDYSTTTPQVVEVNLDSTGMSKFTLRVKNIGSAPLTVHREEVVLHTVKGDRVPLPANNGADTQVIEPGQSQPITVRYATNDLPDDTTVSLRFDKAFSNGDALANAPKPMSFKVGGTNGG